ncbi:parallel beta helix pectate lyase-like protein [Motilibacter rhizosphaerae]|uniref:Parallel beta helix pectate lyase-like protein n=1 Tax=Motilibacter rhizosphaerae TaxID=598652 RepID=A0A4Q7NWT1_9ACTN|nr:right-handed parallel beta-helix repeat-containing protein [Motilibacter rhizosphaerae]RZS90862.1 parallel beta helix pectate lyase-like protein [Motilibacter rhizosphaerae]
MPRLLPSLALPTLTATTLASLLAAAAPSADAASAGRTVSVRTSAQLTAALAGARAGDRIVLAPGTYTDGRGFTAAANGTGARPITLQGSRTAVLAGTSYGGKYGLHITGDHWKVVGLTVQHWAKGIVLDGSVGSVIDSVDVHDIGDEGIHFRSSSSDGLVQRSTVSRTGRAKPQFGEGIYVGSANKNWKKKDGATTFGENGGKGPDRTDRVRIIGNTISDTAAEGIDVKEGTTAGVISGNTFVHAGYSGQNSADSWVDVKGNGWTVTGNTGKGACASGDSCTDAFQVHVVYAGWGTGNTFRANTVSGVPGYVVGVYPTDTPTTVACNDTGAALGPSNIACSG